MACRYCCLDWQVCRTWLVAWLKLRPLVFASVEQVFQGVMLRCWF